MKRLELFTTSPYFNSRDDVSKFIQFHIINKEANLSEFELIQQSYSYVFKNLEFRHNKYNSLKERALKVIEDFIVVETNLKDEANCLAILLSKYGECHSISEYEVVSENLEKFLAKDINVDHNYIQNLYQIFLIKNIYSHSNETKKYDDLLQNTSDKLDIYYLQTKLRISYEILSRSKWKHKKDSPNLVNEVLDVVENYNYRKEKYINMYYLILKSVMEPEVVQNYYELKDLLLNHTHDFTENERNDLLISTTNYCSQKINNGYTEFNVELFNLYDAAISANILLFKGEITSWTFTNLVVLALRLNKLEWAENFVQSYNKYVFRQWSNTYYYNLALIGFEKSDFDQAHELLLLIDEQDVFYLLRSKSLLLKIYYEKMQLQQLISLLESFRKLLIRNTVINDTQKKIYLNFIKYLNNMVMIPNGDNKRIISLKNIIEKDNIVAFKIWLLKCIDNKLS